MKEKYFDINDLYVGCLGTIQYFEEDKGISWTKKKASPYVVYKKRISTSLDNCHECIDVFSGDKYYLLNEVSNRDSILEIIYGKYIVTNSFPLNFVYDNDSTIISASDVKNIICNFNITDSLVKNKDDSNLLLLKICLADAKLIKEEKVKEYYVNNIMALTNRYIDIIMRSSFKNEEYEKIVKDIDNIKHGLDREKEIGVKKIKKMK